MKVYNQNDDYLIKYSFFSNIYNHDINFLINKINELEKFFILYPFMLFICCYIGFIGSFYIPYFNTNIFFNAILCSSFTTLVFCINLIIIKIMDKEIFRIFKESFPNINELEKAKQQAEIDMMIAEVENNG